MHNRTISAKFLTALNLLKIGTITLRDINREVVKEISALEHAKALFTYLNMGGYLEVSLVTKAVTYMAAVKPFAASEATVIKDLTKACEKANRYGKFDAACFLEHFAAEEYFKVTDIIELIVFLQQTAFDRHYGVERNQVKGYAWQESDEYKELMTNLGVTTPRPPALTKYSATFIMGAAASRIVARMNYASALKKDFGVDCGPFYALSGERKLSKGLDDIVFAELETALGKPLEFFTGANNVEFAKEITETMMVNYYIEKRYTEMKIGMVLDSKVEENHWRATTAQNAKDIAPIILQQIAEEKLFPASDGAFRILVIAEQPFTQRMTMAIQREFDLIQQDIKVVLEGAGNAADLTNKNVLAVINSDMGALMMERYNDARVQLANIAGHEFRNRDILAFNNRQKIYENAIKAEAKPETTLKMGA